MSDARLRERVAELEGLLDNERLYTAEHRGYAQVVGEENKLLREQLDAARQALDAAAAVAVEVQRATYMEIATGAGIVVAVQVPITEWATARAALGVEGPAG